MVKIKINNTGFKLFKMVEKRIWLTATSNAETAKTSANPA